MEHEKALKDLIEELYKPYVVKRFKNEHGIKKCFGVLNIIKSYDIAEKLFIDITETDVELFLFGLIKDRGISKSTFNRYLARINAIYNFAIKQKRCKENPGKYIKKTKEEPRDRVLTDNEIKSLLVASAESDNKELYMVVALALNTGMRLNEILNINTKDICGNIIKLKAANNKSGVNREIYLNQNIKGVLEDYIRNSSCKERDGKIFVTKYIKRSYTTALKRAYIYGFRFHDLRRTFATKLMEQGVHIRVIQKALGHKSIKTTERYLSANINICLDAVEKISFV